MSEAPQHSPKKLLIVILTISTPCTALLCVNYQKLGFGLSVFIWGVFNVPLLLLLIRPPRDAGW